MGTLNQTVEEQRSGHAARLSELLRDAIDLVQDTESAYAAFNAHKIMRTSVVKVNDPLSIEDLLCLSEQECIDRQWQADYERLEKAWSIAQYKKRRHIEALRTAGVPQERWIRCGEYAVGISYSNWGHLHFDLHTAPADGPLPSLNHRESGGDRKSVV